MSDTQGIRVTLSQHVTLDQLSDLIVRGLYQEEILDLIGLIVNKVDDTNYREFAYEVVAKIS